MLGFPWNANISKITLKHLKSHVKNSGSYIDSWLREFKNTEQDFFVHAIEKIIWRRTVVMVFWNVLYAVLTVFQLFPGFLGKVYMYMHCWKAYSDSSASVYSFKSIQVYLSNRTRRDGCDKVCVKLQREWLSYTTLQTSERMASIQHVSFDRRNRYGKVCVTRQKEWLRYSKCQ